MHTHAYIRLGLYAHVLASYTCILLFVLFSNSASCIPALTKILIVEVVFLVSPYSKVHYVLLKALPPVCMKYTARDESRVANIARGEAECYICHETFIKSCIFYTNEVAVF